MKTENCKGEISISFIRLSKRIRGDEKAIRLNIFSPNGEIENSHSFYQTEAQIKKLSF